MDKLDRLSTDTRNRDWFTVSVDTLRAWGVLLLVLALAVGAYAAYRRWNLTDLERQASELIIEATNLRRSLDRDEARTSFADFWRIATAELDSANAALVAKDFGRAVDHGRRSRDRFDALRNSLSSPGGKGEATFSTVEGTVKFRRAQSQQWQQADERTVLYEGDHIRTDDGSSEVTLNDGSQYTIRPNTQLVIRAKSSGNAALTIGMEYGWIDLATTRQGGRVSTPGAEARVGNRSEAMVTYDADTRVGQYAAFKGELEVQSTSGDSRSVAAMEQVTQRGDKLGSPERLPTAPSLDAPAESVLLDLDRNPEIQLRWSSTDSNPGYGLQIARDRLFSDRVLDVAKRSKSSALIGLRAEGIYFWRVQAISLAGVRGPWSPARTFRVHKLQGLESGNDTTPPQLTLEKVKAYGNIFIVGGRTEPGSILRINGELVEVASDGAFTKTIQIDKEGWSSLEVRARDAAGNEVSSHPRVFVETL